MAGGFQRQAHHGSRLMKLVTQDARARDVTGEAVSSR